MSLKRKLKSLNSLLLKRIDDYSSQIIGLLGITIVLSAYTLFSVYSTDISKPLSVKEFATTSVKITNLGQNSGGSGSVLKSSADGSEILTNEHICNVIKAGGIVNHNSGQYLIMSYRVYKFHDLCILRVRENLGVNTKVSDFNPDIYDRAHISGHPALLPHVLTEGNFSGHEIINVLTGIRKCKEGDNALICFLLGGMPLIKKYETQLVTGTILPGSSGSAVFNSSGEISGVVFAGRSRELSYAFIVPHAYVKHFLLTKENYKEVTPSYSVSLDGKSEEEVTKSVCRAFGLDRLPICKNAIEVLVWEL
jgi:hypothetical protein